MSNLLLILSFYASRVKAMNRLGESGWSEYGSVTTLIDAARIPRVSGLLWDNETNILSFRVARVYPLYLLARVEASLERVGTNNSSTWQLIKTVPLKKKPYEFLLPRNLNFNNLRSERTSYFTLELTFISLLRALFGIIFLLH